MLEQTRIGQYILERKIGEGGMAEVWQARHVHLANHVAIKFLLPRFAGEHEVAERFLNEGKRQAQLQHPCIVPAIDFLEADGRNFLVMQYVEGQSLDDRLSENGGPLAFDEVHAIAWDVLSALDYAHSLDVVHRDVKPSNILLDRAGRALLTDFGIALALTTDRRVTRTGTAVGTPDYMSPEQIVRPKMVDARSDVYSFGCVLYAMLAGGPPFGTEETTEFYIKDCHVRTPPPSLIERNRLVTPAVEAVVFKCLEKDPAARYQSCAAVMAALHEAASQGAAAAVTPGVGPLSAPAPPPAPPQPVFEARPPAKTGPATVVESHPTVPLTDAAVTPSTVASTSSPSTDTPQPSVVPAPRVVPSRSLTPVMAVLGIVIATALGLGGYLLYDIYFGDAARKAETSGTPAPGRAPATIPAPLKPSSAPNDVPGGAPREVGKPRTPPATATVERPDSIDRQSDTPPRVPVSTEPVTERRGRPGTGEVQAQNPVQTPVQTPVQSPVQSPISPPPVTPAPADTAARTPSEVPTALPPAETAPYRGPSSGTLTYSGPAVIQNGEIVFTRLPPSPLRLTYDANVWDARLAPGDGNTQRLILRNKRPGSQRQCVVRWEIIQ